MIKEAMERVRLVLVAGGAVIAVHGAYPSFSGLREFWAYLKSSAHQAEHQGANKGG